MSSNKLTAFEKRAIPLAKRGFNVFPITEGHKQPPLVKFKEQATTDIDVIKRWAKKWPKANAGIHCKDLIVVDIDVKKDKDGIKTLEQLKNDSVLELPDTYCVTTPNQGLHAYFKHAGGVGNSVSSIGEGLDIRSNGGYVLAAGSVVDGKKYSSNDDDIIDTEVTTAQADLIKLCSQVKEKASNQESIELDKVSESDKEINYKRAEEFLQRREPAIEGNSGDNHTYVTVCKIKDLGVSKDEALELLTTWNERNEPPWTSSELQEKINSAYKYGNEQQGSRLVENNFTAVADKSTQDAKKPSELENYIQAYIRKNTITYGALVKPEVWNFPYVWKGFIPEKGFGVISGPSGIGKTWLSLALLDHISSGKPKFLGHKIKEAVGLYVPFEGADGIPQRKTTLKEKYGTDDNAPFDSLPLNEVLAHVDKDHKSLRGYQILRAKSIEMKSKYGSHPSIIVIDNLTAAMGSSINDDVGISAYYKMCQELVDEFGCVIVSIHHPGKEHGNAARGSIHIKSGADFLLLVEKSKDDDNVLRIYGDKVRDSYSRDAFFKLETIDAGKDQDGDQATAIAVIECNKPKGNTVTPTDRRKAIEVIQNYIQDNGLSDNTVSKSKLTTAFKGAGIKYGEHVTRSCEKVLTALNNVGAVRWDKTTDSVQLTTIGADSSTFEPVESGDILDD